MNDSLQTTVFVQYNPETIACACIYLAARVLQIPLPNKSHWFYLFNATEEDIQNICITLLCVYQTVKTPYEVIEKKVDACREIIQKEKQKVKDAILGDGVNKSAANSPASRPSSPSTNTPKDTKSQSGHRSSTVPNAREENNKVVSNGDKQRHRDDSRIRRSHDLGVKRSRTRSVSNNRSSKYRRQSSSTGSSSEGSSPERRESKHKSGKDMLPKSYSHQNSNRHSDEERRRRRRKETKSRHSKSQRREERDGQKNKDTSRSRRQETTKKHKRKHSPVDVSPPMPLSHLNGDKMSSTSPSSRKSRKQRSDHEIRRKKKSRRSSSPNRSSKR